MGKKEGARFIDSGQERGLRLRCCQSRREEGGGHDLGLSTRLEVRRKEKFQEGKGACHLPCRGNWLGGKQSCRLGPGLFERCRDYIRGKKKEAPDYLSLDE